MLLNILKSSASNVLTMFLNMIASIGCTVIFRSYKTTRSTNTLSLNWPLPWSAKRNMINKKDLKQTCACTTEH